MGIGSTVEGTVNQNHKLLDLIRCESVRERGRETDRQSKWIITWQMRKTKKTNKRITD